MSADRVVPILVVAGAVGSLSASASGSSCAQTVEWRRTTYDAVPARQASTSLTRRLGRGEVVPCLEARGCAGTPPARNATILRIEGVDPEVAVGVEEDAGSVYLAEGYFVELAGHPLHRAVFGRDGTPNETAGLDCGRAFRRIGRRVPPLTSVLRVELDGQDREATFFVDAKTEIAVPERNGLPYVADGQRISITARACGARGGAAKLVAAVVASG